jgi:hypothetical protein
MTRFLPLALFLAFGLLTSGAAMGQEMTVNEPYVEDDSTYIIARDLAVQLAVVSVLEENGRFVYDLDGGEETTTVLFTASAIVARSEIQETVLFILESYEGVAATNRENAYFLTPEAPFVGIQPRESGFSLGPQVTLHRVRVLVCTAPPSGGASGERCAQWTEAEPLSGGDGLQIYIVDGPELGPAPLPMPPLPPVPGTGGQKTTTDLRGQE